MPSSSTYMTPRIQEVGLTRLIFKSLESAHVTVPTGYASVLINRQHLRDLMLASLLLVTGLRIVGKTIQSAANINERCVVIGTQHGWWKSIKKEFAQSCVRVIRFLRRFHTQHFHIAGVRYATRQCSQRRIRLHFKKLYPSRTSPKPSKMLLLQQGCWASTIYGLIRSVSFRIRAMIG